MYDELFSKIYKQYGWDYFSITMGKAIIEYFNKKNIYINSNLDLCCGTGTLCDFFCKNGINSKGIDKSKYMIKIAKENYPNINFIEQDVLKNIEIKEKFDLVTITCDAVNHFLEDNDLNILFSNVNNILKENGYLIFDIYDEQNIEFDKEIISSRENGIIVYYYITKKGNLINTNIIIKQYDKFIYETNVTERLYSLEEIKETLKKYNFVLEQSNDKILNEEQRVKDKLYIICKKREN